MSQQLIIDPSALEEETTVVATAAWCGHCNQQKQVIANNFSSEIDVVSCQDAEGNPVEGADAAACGAAAEAGGFPAWMSCKIDESGEKQCTLIHGGMGALDAGQICQFVDGDFSKCAEN